jgi:hypothetical protein
MSKKSKKHVVFKGECLQTSFNIEDQELILKFRWNGKLEKYDPFLHMDKPSKSVSITVEREIDAD